MATATSTRTRFSNAELLEREMSPGLRVDREAGIIRNVKILGLNSPTRRRRYTAEAAGKSVGLYENALVNLNHSTGPIGSRPLADRIGKLKNVRQGADGGLYADFHYLKSHPMAETIVEAAERMPDAFGFSHDARGDGYNESDGTRVIDRIQAVRSVDLVSFPGTTAGLFESLQDPLPGRSDNGNAGRDKAITSAFRAAVQAAFDDDTLNTKGTLARIKLLLTAQERLIGKGELQAAVNPMPVQESRGEPSLNKRAAVQMLRGEMKSVDRAAMLRRVREAAGESGPRYITRCR